MRGLSLIVRKQRKVALCPVFGAFVCPVEIKAPKKDQEDLNVAVENTKHKVFYIPSCGSLKLSFQPCATILEADPNRKFQNDLQNPRNQSLANLFF